jgi:hypothetical protein
MSEIGKHFGESLLVKFSNRKFHGRSDYDKALAEMELKRPTLFGTFFLTGF